jgi:hypothetical protein
MYLRPGWLQWAVSGRLRLFFFLSPPHLPKNITALGLIAVSRSITVAATELPIPKLIMVIPLAVTLCIGLSRPIIGALSFHCENNWMYFEKLVRIIYSPNCINGRPV